MNPQPRTLRRLCCRTGCRVDAAFYLQVNEFRGNRSVQMQIVDIRPSLCGSAREGESLHLMERCMAGETLLPKEAVRLLPPAGEALEHIQKLNSLLRQELAQLPGVVLHSPEDALPYVLNFSAGKVRGETMLHFLAQREVYVSSGSACGKAKPSHVLESMGLPKEQVQSALRVSFSRFSTEEDVGALVEGLKEGLAQLAVGS